MSLTSLWKSQEGELDAKHIQAMVGSGRGANQRAQFYFCHSEPGGEGKEDLIAPAFWTAVALHGFSFRISARLREPAARSIHFPSPENPPALEPPQPPKRGVHALSN